MSRKTNSIFNLLFFAIVIIVLFFDIDVHTYLLIDSLVALFSACVNFSYFLFHPNGKKWLRYLTGGWLLWFSVVEFLAFMYWIEPSTHGPLYIRPYLPILYMISAFDVMVDSAKKKEIKALEKM